MDEDVDRPREDAAIDARIVGFPRAEAHEPLVRSIDLPVDLAAFLGRAQQAGREQWLQSFLVLLGPGEALTLRIAIGSGGGLRLGARVCAPAQAIEARARDLSEAFGLALACALPGLKKVRRRRSRAVARPYVARIRPAGRLISLDDLARQSLRTVANGGSANVGSFRAGLRLAAHPGRRPDLAAVVALLARPELRDAELVLGIQPFRLDAAHVRGIQEFLKGLSDHLQSSAPWLPTLFHLNEQALAQLKQWCIADRSLRLDAELSAPEEVAPVMLDMLCQALYGDTRAISDETDTVDLAPAWPDLDLSFLERLPAIPRAQARFAANRRARKKGRSSTVGLGSLDDGTALRLDRQALEQHLHLIGGTGTGKSTLMLNMIAETMRSGGGVFLIDAHGDLWEKALRLVPPARRNDLVLLHPVDERGAFTMNVLETLGEDIDSEHARIVDELLDLFKRTLWREVPEAFGPMFTNYFRNGLLLLLNVQRENASILDFPRVFGDDDFRRGLVAKCTNKDVAFFWKRIVDEARGDADLDNHAPYVVCKLTPITGNAVTKRILGATRSTFDLRHVIERQQICLINLAQPQIGKEASRFLGGVITSRLVAAAKTQSRLPPEQRRRLNVYMDEFQTYISAALADGLAEVRKFGLNLVLANQSLSQLHGDRYQAEVAEAVMANAANVISFRVGIADAMRLALKFEPSLAPQDLTRLPNYHAAGLLLEGGGLGAPVLFATPPEPKGAGGPPQDPPVSAGLLNSARAAIVRAVGRRGAQHKPD